MGHTLVVSYRVLRFSARCRLLVSPRAHQCSRSTSILRMIEREDWYDDVFLRDQRGHYCVECQKIIVSDMDVITHLLNEHKWEEVDFHVDW